MNQEKPDYSQTVNLPVTGFPMKAGLPQREPAMIERWHTGDLYGRMRRRSAGRPRFILHDGPPYANGHIHLGTALNKVLKDFIVKYKTMAGFDAPYTPGWDCHGLPIEQQCMKKLKKDKHSVEMSEFRAQAAEFARGFVDIQRDEFKRLEVLGDWARPYLTLDPAYESTIVKVFGALVKAGYIYRQKKPVYWCPSCETALADAEVEYAPHKAHSIFVAFPLLRPSPSMALSELADTAVLAWTTTPWTLPANAALAFNPAAEYALAELTFPDVPVRRLILSSRLLPMIAERLGAVSHSVLRRWNGAALESLVCSNPLVERESVGILADFVSLEDGTGVVHIAPGHGHDDYAAGLSYHLPIISPVNDWGGFTSEVPEFAGLKVLAANDSIINRLREKGHLLKAEPLEHSYPHCWRCKKPVIFRATPQWFMSVEHDALRGRLKDSVTAVKWVPASGEQRIAGMLETRPDWCLSRQRLWGVPVPVFYCAKCGEPLVSVPLIEHIADLFAAHGADAWFSRSPAELMDGLSLSCASCGGSEFAKENDILDVWFDSGVSHEAVLASGAFPGLSWPADLYLEGSDQHRGWFQTSLLPAVALRGRAPYSAVLTHGFVVDGSGKKMSKSTGNVMAPDEIIGRYGADILRLWVATSDYRDDIRIAPEIISGLVDSYRKIRNTFRYLLGNLHGYTVPGSAPAINEFDRHALAMTHALVRQMTAAFDNYEFHRAAGAAVQFCTVFLSGFYLDSLKDTLYCDPKSTSAAQSARWTLWQIAVVLSRLMAPLTSFTSEEVWDELRALEPRLIDSVLLADFPVPDESCRESDDDRALWDVRIRARELALGSLEQLRRDKIIGSNLEGAVRLAYAPKMAPAFSDQELLCRVIGSWDVIAVADAAVPDNEAVRVVSAARSVHARCDRCWRHVQGINEQGLCGRCSSAITQIQAARA